MCDEYDIDFGVQLVEAGSNVILHDHVLHIDFRGLDRVKVGIQIARQLYEETQSSIEAAIPPLMRARSRVEEQQVGKTFDAERSARDGLMQQAIECYSAAHLMTPAE